MRNIIYYDLYNNILIYLNDLFLCNIKKIFLEFLYLFYAGNDLQINQNVKIGIYCKDIFCNFHNKRQHLLLDAFLKNIFLDLFPFK